MGSSSIASPVDLRLAVTDNAFGMTTSLGGNNSSLGYAPNSGIRNAHDVSYLEEGSNLLKGNTFRDGATLQFLDGGAIDKAFDFSAFSLDKSIDFAAYSLSQMLASVIDGNKASLAAQNYTSDSLGRALTSQGDSISAALQNAAGAQASTLGAALTNQANSIGAWLENAAGEQASVLGGALTSQASSIGQALTQATAAQIAAARANTQAAQQAAAKAVAEQKETADRLRAWLTENGKKLLIGGAVLGAGWWLMKKRGR